MATAPYSSMILTTILSLLLLLLLLLLFFLLLGLPLLMPLLSLFFPLLFFLFTSFALANGLFFLPFFSFVLLLIALLYDWLFFRPRLSLGGSLLMLE